MRAAFDRKVGEEHPDAGGESGGFARLREAYETLRSPGRRLRHWLELAGERWEAGGQVPPVMMDLFGLVGELIQRVDALAAKKDAATSVLGKSLLEREGIALVEEVEQMRARIGTLREEEVARFEEFEAVGAVACGVEALEVARTLLFLEKWDGQLRERWADLAA